MSRATLERLQTLETCAKAQLLATKKKLKALTRQQRALAAKESLQRQQAVGKLVEELGLPMDLETLRPLLEWLREQEGAGV